MSTKATPTTVEAADLVRFLPVLHSAEVFYRKRVEQLQAKMEPHGARLVSAAADELAELRCIIEAGLDG